MRWILIFCTSTINSHIAIYNCYYLLSYTKYRSKQKNYWHTNNVRMENNELKKVGISNRSYYFDDIIKIEDIDFNKFLLVKK